MTDGNGQLDLVGTFEAHLILGVERSRIARWLSENEQGKAKIPEPVAFLRSGPVWLRPQIEELLVELAKNAGVGARGLNSWAVERSLRRAQQVKPPVDRRELEEIIRRPVRKASRAKR